MNLKSDGVCLYNFVFITILSNTIMSIIILIFNSFKEIYAEIPKSSLLS